MTIKSILQKYWGWEHFRPGQEEAIKSVISGKDTLVVLPTGGGKSLCYQLAGLYHQKLTLVISPLIALMLDQVNSLQDRGINAMSISGALKEEELVEALDRCQYGKLDFLYISPERLQHPLLKERLQKLTIGMVVVDEAHCISQWGHDFRPSYRTIHETIRLIGSPVVMALTATATPLVKEDISESLQLQNPKTIQTSFDRHNLSYAVVHTTNKLGSLTELIQKCNGNCIVYMRTRKHCESLAEQLRIQNIAVNYFHGGSENKEKLLSEWSSGKTPVMVATTAFGMGIDQANVRYVIHAALPESIESYYQEAGRAGRDSLPARAVILTGKRDIENLYNQFVGSVPSYEEIKSVYKKLCSFLQVAYGEKPEEQLDFSFENFTNVYSLSPTKSFNSLRLMDQFGLIQLQKNHTKKYDIKVLIDGHSLANQSIAGSPTRIILELLMRQYGGIDNQYHRIHTAWLQKRTGINKEDLEKHFLIMEQQGFIELKSIRSDISIWFLEPRQDEYSLSRIKKILEHKIKTKKKQLKSVEDYVHSQDCKRNFILNYFGEKTHKDCGQCSSCEKPMDEHRISQDILGLLQNKTETASVLAEQSKINSKMLNKVLMRLLDEEKIIFHNNKYSIRK
jgi:ATP-dependent DNA helicase RecQ